MDSKDRRSKREKLRDMANQSDSPHEAEIAKKKLQEMEPETFTYINSYEVSFTVKMTPEGFDFFRQWSGFSTASGFGEY